MGNQKATKAPAPLLLHVIASKCSTSTSTAGAKFASAPRPGSGQTPLDIVRIFPLWPRSSPSLRGPRALTGHRAHAGPTNGLKCQPHMSANKRSSPSVLTAYLQKLVKVHTSRWSSNNGTVNQPKSEVTKLLTKQKGKQGNN